MATLKGGSVPASKALAVTTGDTSGSNFSLGVSRGLYIGGAGNAAVVDVDGTAVLFSGLVAGSILPFEAIRVNTTSTTATNIVALF